jgi:hypothetical protein
MSRHTEMPQAPRKLEITSIPVALNGQENVFTPTGRPYRIMGAALPVGISPLVERLAD